MSDRESRVHITAEEAAHLLELTESAAQAENLDGLAQRVLPILVRVMGATGAILCLEEPKPPFHSLFHAGIPSDTLPALKGICTERFQHLPIRDDSPPLSVPLSPQAAAQLILFSLGARHETAGVFRPSAAGAGQAAPANAHAQDYRPAHLFHRPFS